MAERGLIEISGGYDSVIMEYENSKYHRTGL